MIIFLFNVYLLILFLLVRFKVVSFNLFWKISPLLVLLLLNGRACSFPMGWGAPSGPVLVVRHSVQIVPNVAGEVIEVPMTPNMPLKANDVLFRIDPDAVSGASRCARRAAQVFRTTFRADERTGRAGEAGRVFDVQQRDAEVKQLKAQLASAQWNLEQTVVRAPADGYVTNLALRKGARVASLPLAPVMAFIDTSETMIGTEIAQINARYIEPGQNAEVTFKMLPGHIFTGRVEADSPGRRERDR